MLVGQGAKQFSFPAKPCDIFLLAEMDHFESDLAMQLVIGSQVHLCHAALSQLTDKVVAAQCCSFQGWHGSFSLPPCLESIVEDKGPPCQRNTLRQGTKVRRRLPGVFCFLWRGRHVYPRHTAHSTQNMVKFSEDR